MKLIYCIGLFILLFVSFYYGFSQTQFQKVQHRQFEINSEIKNERGFQNPTHITWERIVYRNVDLTKKINTPLYYPIQPIGNHTNFFTLIFKLMMNETVTAYNYLDGCEIFTEDQKIDFENILRKYRIPYSKKNNHFLVEESSIPSSEVSMYLIKERYYFDQATGTFNFIVLAICPLLVRRDDYYGGTTKDPLFWITYDELRPYISHEMIMTSNYNNVLTFTIDDYLRKGMYRGDIVKTINLMDKSLDQEFGDDSETLKYARDSIENQLKAFAEKLWVYNDSIRRNIEIAKSKRFSIRHNDTTRIQRRENHIAFN